MADAPLTGEIAIEGLAAVLSGLETYQGEIKARLRERLLAAANQAASYAIFIARAKGLYSSGELIDQIKAGMRSNYAYITDTARRVSHAYPAGFNYPAIYEYGGSTTRRAHGGDYTIHKRSAAGARLIAQHGLGEGSVGPRAFLWPAAVEGQPQLLRSVEQALEQLAVDCGLQPV